MNTRKRVRSSGIRSSKLKIMVYSTFLNLSTRRYGVKNGVLG